MNALPTDLEDWDRTRLVEHWKKAFGQLPPPHMRIEFLSRAIAWQIQRGTTARVAAKPSPARSRHPIPLAPGTLLIREWQGESHRVQVTGSGFDYQGKTYRSLSAIARTITGTPWSGPAFFGTTP